MVGCVSTEPKITHKGYAVDKDGQSYYGKVFPYTYEEVWRAAQLSVKYPIAVNNMDNGVLETDWVKAIDGFSSPIATKAPTAGNRYKIILNMVKGKMDSRAGVRVTIRKKIEKQSDFFSDVESLNSDGLEEEIILYRIEREIVIDDAIRKAAKAANN
jgi:hypothetical protein